MPVVIENRLGNRWRDTTHSNPWRGGRGSRFFILGESPLLVREQRPTYLAARRRKPIPETLSLRQRLDNANSYFRRKASEVFNDEAALRLLARLYQDIIVEIQDFDSCASAIPLAKLTAANFCEVGANSIYITEPGQRFIESIREHE